MVNGTLISAFKSKTGLYVHLAPLFLSHFITLNKTNQFMPPEMTSNGYPPTGTAQVDGSPRQYYGDLAIPAPTQPVQSNIIRPLTIRQLNHGYIVDVGCQTFAIENTSTLIAKLSEYLLNPLDTEIKFQEGKFFN